MAPSSAAEETLTPLADSLQQHPVTLLQRNSQPQEAKQKDHTPSHRAAEKQQKSLTHNF